MKVENSIETQYRALASNLNYEFEELYSFVSHTRLKIIFSTLHSRLVNLFDTMNSRLPTGDYVAHFWADPSRDLIEVIGIIDSLLRSLKNTELSFSVDEYYEGILSRCKTFLQRSGGSQIPPSMEKIELYYTIPIFSFKNVVSIDASSTSQVLELKFVGEGSYAFVYKYFDKFYQKIFALKRAKNDLSEKERKRFEREFEQMNSLSSPYVVEVFCYDKKKNEYIMEFMDCTLDEYIKKNNIKIDYSLRKNICNQILRAFSYIHSKELLHRDISPKNILLRTYEDIIVVKISDFGLVRIPDSSLTSENTELKGYFNDPNLRLEGFNNYAMHHETYALTRLLYFVLTGKTNTDKISNLSIDEFVRKGLHPVKVERYKSVNEISDYFNRIRNE